MKYLIILALLFSCPAFAKSFKDEPPVEVTVKQIIDGDTFVSTTGKHIRIWGINTPEKGEAGYWAAGMFLELRAYGVTLSCKMKAKDRYKRDVMQCFNGSIDLASYMIRTGYAREYIKYSKGYYSKDEAAAKAEKRGFWNPDLKLTPYLKYTPE